TYDHRLDDSSPRGSIRLGLRIIKGLSHEGALEVIKQRPSVGYQHTGQLKHIGINQKDLNALASANAMQSFAHNRFA
ncbi:hypothetical protein ACPV5V_33460, partial [Vibrio campbellii]